MGILLKIALFGVAAYIVWTTARRWLVMFGGLAKAPPPDRPPEAPRPDARPAMVQDTQPCAVCGDYVSPSSAKCGRVGCPQP
jgi:hypothetical protein